MHLVRHQQTALLQLPGYLCSCCEIFGAANRWVWDWVQSSVSCIQTTKSIAGNIGLLVAQAGLK